MRLFEPMSALWTQQLKSACILGNGLVTTIYIQVAEHGNSDGKKIISDAEIAEEAGLPLAYATSGKREREFWGM